MKDRRIARRYGLSVPVIVRTSVDKEGTPRTGKTRDISTQGVYFTIDNNLSAGAKLDLTMILSAQITGGTEVLIRASGKVIRVDKHSGDVDQKVDVAAVFEMHEIVRNEPAIT
jgi:PilZ domain